MSTSPQGDALKLQPAEGLKEQQDALEPLQTLRTKSLEVDSERFADYPCGGRGATFTTRSGNASVWVVFAGGYAC
jgi:hypothetical protein